MKIISVYNIKGGVGKTATSVNLAYLAAKDNCRTLLCDLDPQGSTSFYFRIKPPRKLNGKKLLESKKGLAKNIRETDYELLELLPADWSFRELDLLLNDLKKSGKRLKKIFEPLRKDYDLILIDCPPNITLLSENIFHASDFLLVPNIPTTLSMMTYQKLEQFFEENKLDSEKLRPFFSMAERRKKLHRETINEHIDSRNVLKTVIPYVSDVEKMGQYRQPVGVFKAKSNIARTYNSLWKEVKGLL